MARVWPQAVNCGTYFLQEEDIPVDMPNIAEQERLINLYFTYVHPAFPVVHKEQFIAQFNARSVFALGWSTPIITDVAILSSKGG